MANGQVSFEAICNAEEVLIGNPFEVSFQLRNAEIKRLEPPSFNGFQAQGPSTSQSISYINGRSSSQQSYSYYLLTNKPGTYKIGSATVITKDGKSFKSEPITVKVVEKSSSANGSGLGNKVFLRVELSNSEAVVGEQVMVDIRIYTQVGIEHTELLKEPVFENMYSYYLRNFEDKAKVVVVNGQQYITQILRRIVVFPSKSGTINIDPAIIEIGVSSTQGHGLFNPFSVVSYTLQSPETKLNVRDLDSAPNDYAGVVGKYTMMAHANKNTITSDNVLELTIRVQGEGDIKQVPPPSLGIDKKYFEEFKPTINEEVREGFGLLGGLKEFQYVLTPRATGDFAIQPKFVYFDSHQKRFVTIDTTIFIKVTKGSIPLPTKAERDAMKEEIVIDEQEENEEKPLEFNAPLTTAQFVSKNASPFLGSIVFWILSVLPFCALGVFFVWKKKEEEKENIPAPERKRNNASSEAAIRLQNAKKELEQGRSKEFYSEISKALLGFVSDKFNIPLVDLTKENMRQKLIAQNIDNQKIDTLVSILQNCEMAVFAGLTTNSSMEKVYHETTALLDGLA